MGGPPRGFERDRPHAEDFWTVMNAGRHWYEKDDGCFIWREKNENWFINTPDGERRYWSFYDVVMDRPPRQGWRAGGGWTTLRVHRTGVCHDSQSGDSDSDVRST